MARTFSSRPASVQCYLTFLILVLITAFISLVLYIRSENQLVPRKLDRVSLKELQGNLPEKFLFLQKLHKIAANNTSKNTTIRNSGPVLLGKLDRTLNQSKKSDVNRTVIPSAAEKMNKIKRHGEEEVNSGINVTLNCNVHLFYYLWYGNPKSDGKYIHWNHKYLPHWSEEEDLKWPHGNHNPPDDIAANFFPEMGAYSSADPSVMDKHMNHIQSSGAGVIAVSWYPPGQSDENGLPVDQLIPALLDSAHKHGVKVAIHIEPYRGRSGETLRKYIKYIVDSYGKHPGFYRKEVGGKQLPVYYVYDSYQIESAQWAQALKPGGEHSLRDTQYDGLFLGLYLGHNDEHKLLSAGFDGFYTYFAANGFTKGSSWSNWKNIAKFAADNNLLFVPSVGPGYVDTRVRPWNAQTTRKRLQGKYFRQSFQAALDAGVKVISVTSFNEWHEGTQVEPAVPKAIEGFKYEDYSPGSPDFYLQLLKEFVSTFSDTQHGISS